MLIILDFNRSLSLTVYCVCTTWQRCRYRCWTCTHKQNTLIHIQKGQLTPTLLRERLLKDALVETAERRAEVLEVREAERLVPRLRDGQTVLGLRGRRGRRRKLAGLLKAQGLGWRLRVVTHLRGGTEKDTRDRLWEGIGSIKIYQRLRKVASISLRPIRKKN